ncbi:MAG: hypothetical protein ABIT20_00020 [Gemmatimonadaceae bacterium]
MNMWRVALIALMCLPTVIRAQQPTGTVATQPNAVAGTFLSFGRPYDGWLVLALDSIPASQYGFRPTPIQQSIGFIAQHLETANYGLCTIFGADTHGLSAKDSLADTIKARWPKDTLIARVRASLLFCARRSKSSPTHNWPTSSPWTRRAARKLSCGLAT